MPTPATRRLSAVRPSTWAWCALPLALAGAMGAWCALGLSEADAGDLARFFAVAALSAAVALARDLTPFRLPNAALLTGIVVLTGLALELPWNDRLPLLPPNFALLELAMIAVVVLALYLAFQRRGAGPALGAVLFALVGLAQYFVVRFKYAAILPSDVLALGTAAAVAGNYRYVIDSACVQALTALAAALGLCAQFRPPAALPDAPARRKRVARNLGGSLACVLALALAVTCVDFASLGVTFDYWWALNKYREQGILPTFTLFAQQLPIREPAGYSDAAAERLQREYADAWAQGAGASRAAAEEQFANERPSIVVVMNETFADLSIYQGFIKGYEGPAFFKSVPEGSLATGPLAVSVFGGGTCNTEFEFLTGSSLAFIGAGKYPYSLYNLSDVESIPSLLGQEGYHTVAMHPNFPSNWQRGRIYPQLGFDEFLSISDFRGAGLYHNHVSDASTYRKVLAILEGSKEPVFVFDVTMQNHSGYDTGIIPEGDLPSYKPKGLSADIVGQLNEYLACITESDRALEEFVEDLRHVRRPVVLVFFGDHQPYLAEDMDNAANPSSSDMERVVQKYQTSYLVWANYDVAGVKKPKLNAITSPNYLGLSTLELVGAPLSEFQRAQLQGKRDIPALTLMAYLDAYGDWHTLDDGESPMAETFQELVTIDYLNLGKKV